MILEFIFVKFIGHIIISYQTNHKDSISYLIYFNFSNEDSTLVTIKLISNI